MRTVAWLGHDKEGLIASGTLLVDVTPRIPLGSAYTLPSGVIIPAGWVNPADTGLRGAGLTVADLTPSGSISTSKQGQVVEGLDISGGVTINHTDCVIRNNRIRYSGTAQAIRAPDRNLGARAQVYNNLMEQPLSVTTVDVEGIYQLWFADIHHNDISGFPDGIINCAYSVMHHNLIHDFTRRTGDHADCTQFTNDVDYIVEHNTFLNIESGRGKLTKDANGVWKADSGSFGNAVCQLGSQAGRISGFHFRRNYIYGGYYCFNANASKEATHGPISGRYYENIFSGVMKYGTTANTPGAVTVERSNVWERTADFYTYDSSTGAPKTVWHCVAGQPIQEVIKEPA